MGMSEEEVFLKVRQALMDSLGVTKEEVTPNTVLTTDLGAESIDFLDIAYRLEQGFGIKIPRGELFPEDLFQDATFAQRGRITPAGLAMLRERLPHADFHDLEDDPRLENIGKVFKVQTITQYLLRKLNGSAS